MATRLVTLAVMTGVLLSAACSTEPSQDLPGRPSAGPRPGTLQIERIPLHDQPLALAHDHGSLWVTTGRLLRLRNGEIVERFSIGGSRVGLTRAAGRLWLTGGGDGGVPDGTILGIEPDGGEVVQRMTFPEASPYGIDAGPKGIFAALFQGELVRIHPGGDSTARIRLGYGLTQVLVARRVVWVSQPQRGNVWRVVVHRDDMNAAATELQRASCPQGLDSSRNAIWVADPCAGRVWLLDPRSGAITDAIRDVGKKPVDVDVTGNLVWIVSLRDEVVSVIDLDSRAVLEQGKAGAGALAIAARGHHAWVANTEDYSLTHLHLSSR
ncbi:MAG: hypothetical protein ACRDKZ_11570 [Actinomycetota bacterium]